MEMFNRSIIFVYLAGMAKSKLMESLMIKNIHLHALASKIVTYITNYVFILLLSNPALMARGIDINILDDRKYFQF